nr:hypothetical protein [Mucilaginibacter sp. SP1R1]
MSSILFKIINKLLEVLPPVESWVSVSIVESSRTEQYTIK